MERDKQTAIRAGYRAYGVSFALQGVLMAALTFDLVALRARDAVALIFAVTGFTFLWSYALAQRGDGTGDGGAGDGAGDG